MVISVIVPIYKGKKYIPNIIEMMLENVSHIPDSLELIFVNDFPDDEIERYVEKVLNEQKKQYDDVLNIVVKVINNEANLGIHMSRIIGITACTGDYLLMLDQDDEITRDYFLSQKKAIKNADLVVANGIEKKPGYNKMLYKYQIMQWTVKHLWFYVMFDSRIISPGQCLIRKKSIPKQWLDNPLKNNGADDYMLWLLMLSEAKKFEINRDCLYVHVYTANNLSLDANKIKKSTYELLNIIGNAIGQKNVNIIMKRLESGNKSLFVKMVESVNKVK